MKTILFLVLVLVIVAFLYELSKPTGNNTVEYEENYEN